MKLTHLCLISWVVFVILSMVESKNHRKPHRHHRHPKHNSHRHSQDRKNQSFIRKKRSQNTRSSNSTPLIVDFFNASTLSPSTRGEIESLGDLGQIFGLASTGLWREIATPSPKNPEISKDEIKKKTEIKKRKMSLLDFDIPKIFGGSDTFVDGESSEAHIRVKRNDYSLNQLSLKHAGNNSIGISNLKEKKKATDDEIAPDYLYEDPSVFQNRHKRFANAAKNFNDENTIFKNSLKDVYPETAEDSYYQLPLVKLVRTKRFGNLYDKPLTIPKNKRQIENVIRKKKIGKEIRVKKEENNRENSKPSKNLTLRSENKYQKNSNEVGYYDDVQEKPISLETCHPGGKKISILKNDQTRSVQEVKRLAGELITKVDELENFLDPSPTSNFSKSIRRVSDPEKPTNFSARGSSGSRLKSSGLPSSVRRVRKHERRKKRKSNRKWDRWTDWSSCSVTCGKGRQIRWRHCIRDCSTAETEMEEKICHFPACAPGKFLGIFK